MERWNVGLLCTLEVIIIIIIIIISFLFSFQPSSFYEKYLTKQKNVCVVFFHKQKQKIRLYVFASAKIPKYSTLSEL